MTPDTEPPRYALNTRTIAQYLVAKRKFHKWRLRAANDKLNQLEAEFANPDEDAPEWDDLNDDAYYHQRCLEDIEKERAYLVEARSRR